MKVQKSARSKMVTSAQINASVKYGRITKDFSDNYAVDGDLVLSFIDLTSLEGAPEKVFGNCMIVGSTLLSLKGSPQYVRNGFNVSLNSLHTLEGGPTAVGSRYDCMNNLLINLVGSPKVVESMDCHSNILTSLEGIPRTFVPVNGHSAFNCQDNRLTSLHNIHHLINELPGEFDCTNNPIKSHILGILKIKKLHTFITDNVKLSRIINKYLPEGDILDCQEELIENGFEEFAQL